MNKPLDNLPLADVSVILTEDTAPVRYYPLIPVQNGLIDRLAALDIRDKYGFFDAVEARLGALCGAGLDEAALILFSRFLHISDFRERALKEFPGPGVEPKFLDALTQRGIVRSGGYILLCMSAPGDPLLRAYPNEAARLLSLCDLMRLPGVKGVRAQLYYDCGYTSLKKFARQDADAMQKSIGRYAAEGKTDKSVPFKKELLTQIAYAKVLPGIDSPLLK